MGFPKPQRHKPMKKICVVVASRANYGRVKYLLKEIESSKYLELQLIVGASTLLDRFGKCVEIIKNDGFTPIRSLHYVIEGETLSTQAKSTGLGIIELASAFEELKPDMVLTVADRFETMSTAIAASYLNIPLIHLQGGEISGNIDDRVRHSITKLADIHFVCSKESAERVISMGENPSTVFNYGCPSLDILVEEDMSLNKEKLNKYKGVGININWDKEYILMIQHPVTNSYGQGFKEVSETLLALQSFKNIQKIILWPNLDAGSDDISKGIRCFREENHNDLIHYQKNYSPEDYARVLKNAICCVGNSSSFIREGSFLGVPCVLVGDRQRGREYGKNILSAGYNREEIERLLEIQINKKKYKSEDIYGNGNASKKIVKKIEEILIEKGKIKDFYYK